MPADLKYTIRFATPTDAAIIAHHRRAMFEDMHAGTPASLDVMDAKFTPWVKHKIARGEYIGWLVIDEHDAVIAGAGVWLIEASPTPTDQSPKRGYVMNVYVEKNFRRQGLARQLMRLIIDYCRDNNLRSIALHASEFGRPLYESLGFKQTNEMRLLL